MNEPIGIEASINAIQPQQYIRHSARNTSEIVYMICWQLQIYDNKWVNISITMLSLATRACRELNP